MVSRSVSGLVKSEISIDGVWRGLKRTWLDVL